MSVYHPNTESLRRISVITAEAEIDIVVIGNNLGAGRIKAAHVAKRLYPHTIIISNGVMYEFEEEPYKKLGITRFSPRYNLAVQIRELLAFLS